MRILWFSNAPWAPTGYGGQTAQVVQRLAADGHDVAIAANYGLAASPQLWRGIPVLPQGFDQYSNDVLADHYRAFSRGEPTLLLTLYDVWPIHAPDVPMASWVPIDHVPVPPEVQDWCRGRTILSMSRFGADALEKAGIPNTYIPHAVEAVYRPTPSDWRERQQIPADAFVVAINAANISKVVDRKGWDVMFLALARLMRDHDDVYVYAHTDPRNPGGFPLDILTVAAGIPFERMRWADQYRYKTGLYTPEDVAKVYSAADVLLSTSLGEGFGLAPLEAQACGCPVIVTDFTAQPELCGAGWTVKYQPAWDKTQGAWFGQPILADVLRQLEQAYAARGDQALRVKARAFALNYDADAVFDCYWRPALRTLEANLLTPPTRQQRRQAARSGRKGRAA